MDWSSYSRSDNPIIAFAPRKYKVIGRPLYVSRQAMSKLTPVRRCTTNHCILLHASVRIKQWEMRLGPNHGARHTYMLYLCSICNTCVVPWGKDIDWPPRTANRHNKPHGVPKRNASERRLPRQTTLQGYFLNIDRFFFRYQLSDGSVFTVTKPRRWED